MHDYVYQKYQHTVSEPIQNSFAEMLFVKFGKTIVNRSGTVDILEQDALKATDKNAFDYFNGIASCYKKTNADPYWNGSKRKSSYERPNWATSKIPV